MNAKFGGFQTSPKLRLLLGSVVAVIWRLVRVLLVEVREVGHEVTEVVIQSVHIFIHILKSVIDLPNALVELLELLVAQLKRGMDLGSTPGIPDNSPARCRDGAGDGGAWPEKGKGGGTARRTSAIVSLRAHRGSGGVSEVHGFFSLILVADQRGRCSGVLGGNAMARDGLRPVAGEELEGVAMVWKLGKSRSRS